MMDVSYAKAFAVMAVPFLTAIAVGLFLLALDVNNTLVVLPSVFTMVLSYGLVGERIEHHLYEARGGKYYGDGEDD